MIKRCAECKNDRLKSQYTSERAHICNICKLKRSRRFLHKSVVCNASTKLLKEKFITMKYKSGHQQYLSLKNAMIYVREGAAVVINHNTIVEKYTEDEIIDLVQSRDEGSCQLCGALGKHVEFIVSRNSGGKKTPLNMHHICEECKNRLKVGSDSSNPKTANLLFRPLFETKNAKHLEVYCDCSLYNPELVGIGVVLSEHRLHKTFGELMYLDRPINSVYGELLALRQALKMLVDQDFRKQISSMDKITVYSDVDHIDLILNKKTRVSMYTEVLHDIHDLILLINVIYPKLLFLVRYIGDHRNECYYRAHHIARTWIALREDTPIYGKNIV